MPLPPPHAAPPPAPHPFPFPPLQSPLQHIPYSAHHSLRKAPAAASQQTFRHKNNNSDTRNPRRSAFPAKAGCLPANPEWHFQSQADAAAINPPPVQSAFPSADSSRRLPPLYSAHISPPPSHGWGHPPQCLPPPPSYLPS